MRLLVLFVFGSVMALGLARITAGLQQGKSVGFLMLLVALTAAVDAFFLIAQEHPRRTARGDEALKRCRQRQIRAVSRESELLLAYALNGPAILTGTHLAEFQRLQKRPGSGGGGSDGAGDGGSCGDDD